MKLSRSESHSGSINATAGSHARLKSRLTQRSSTVSGGRRQRSRRVQVVDRSKPVAAAGLSDFEVPRSITPDAVEVQYTRSRELDSPLTMYMRAAGQGALMTPQGEVTLRVPPHTVHGAKLRLRGKGIPGSARREASDLMVHIEIAPLPETPATEEAMKVLETVQPTAARDDLRF